MAFSFRFFHHRRDTILCYGLDRLRADLQSNPFSFFRNVKTLFLEIGEEPSFGLVVSVRNVVSHLRPLSRNLTNSCHVRFDLIKPFRKGSANIAKTSLKFQRDFD